MAVLPWAECHPCPLFLPALLPTQAQFRTSRGSQHLIEPDDAAAYYGPCPPPPGPCARPRGINLDTDLFNMTPYHRFKDNSRYKGGWAGGWCFCLFVGVGMGRMEGCGR